MNLNAKLCNPEVKWGDHGPTASLELGIQHRNLTDRTLTEIILKCASLMSLCDIHRVPTRTGKPGKWEGIFQSGNFEQTGKVRENHTKYWKTEINWDKYYLIFLVIFKWDVHYLLKWIKFLVKKQNIKEILEKWQKILEKSGNFVSPEKWEPWSSEKGPNVLVL